MVKKVAGLLQLPCEVNSSLVQNKHSLNVTGYLSLFKSQLRMWLTTLDKLVLADSTQLEQILKDSLTKI